MKPPSTPAIYAITNLDTGKRYVGGTINLRRRWREHRSYLHRGIHWATLLQADWASLGPLRFAFEVLEHVQDHADVLVREQFWLDSSQHEYNLSPTAGSVAGSIKGPLSNAHKAKLSAAKKGKPLAAWHREFLAEIQRNRSPEWRRKISESKKGKKPSEETRAKMSAAKLGTKLSSETRAKQSAAALGKPKTAEHRAKLSLAAKAREAAKRR